MTTVTTKKAKPPCSDECLTSLEEYARSGDAPFGPAAATLDVLDELRALRLVVTEDAAARAQGWASAAERAAYMAPEHEPLYVVIDTRTIVGNTPLFWMPNSNGYGSVIAEVGRYSHADAHSKRETDFPVPLEIAVECARPRVDIQLLNRVLDREGLKVPSMGWGHPPRCVDCERKANPRRRR